MASTPDIPVFSSPAQRIAHYEALMNDASSAVHALQAALLDFSAVQPKLDQLTAYYESAAWKQDFAADEAGLLPPDLHRGVLSEDGLFLLLEDARALRSVLNYLDSSAESE